MGMMVLTSGILQINIRDWISKKGDRCDRWYGSTSNIAIYVVL